MMRIAVVLPAPFGPRKPVTAPGGAWKLTPFRAVAAPYDLVMSVTSIIGMPSACFSVS